MYKQPEVVSERFGQTTSGCSLESELKYIVKMQQFYLISKINANWPFMKVMVACHIYYTLCSSSSLAVGLDTDYAQNSPYFSFH